MRHAIQSLEESKIREVANAGMGRSDVLAFWFGESDEVTPEFIREAAIESLRKGETFYAHNLGLPELRDAIAGYTTRLHGNVKSERIAVTSGGVNAQSREEQQTILDHCRKTGTWILADEVYERLYFEPSANACAPSFLDVASPDDRLVVCHSFSKSFLMTGWRLGWLVMPAAMTHHMGKLIEFNTSCASVFTQRAAQVAMERTDEVTPRIVAHLKACRDTLVPKLQAIPQVEVQPAKGGMYAFFKLSGFDDSLVVAKRLVAEAGLGLAPGNAFAPEAQGWLRWCFASKDKARLEEGVQRLKRWLA
jgi:aspartate/methionine/tyrosine aminotransferase